MAPFKALYIRRSDGKVDVVGKGRRTEKNQPTDDQLDQTPDKNGVSDYYREVHLTDAKHLDWRRKLGGMLARQLEAGIEKTSDVGYILAALPEGYRLFEHVKKTEKDGKLEVKAKTHAAGGNDRQDAYLYGHPMGRKKRYRSPADFFPHLLWLGVDESGDPDNCTCKICCPEDAESLGLATVPKIKPEHSASEQKPTVAQPPPSSQKPNVPGTKVKSENSVALPKSATAAPRQNQSTPLPAMRLADQITDSHYKAFMYRPGELVWFKRGQPWGLGVITRRWASPSKQLYYTVQPLSYPGHNPPAVTKTSDLELRPWLAWSVPRYTTDQLNNINPPPTYDTADWQGMAMRKYGGGDMEVDGSILAAKAIDATYTLFGKNDTFQTEPGLVETSYNGIYLGAEKIWAGEPVRLRIGSGTDILIVHRIIQQQRISTSTKQITQRSIWLQGDVYCLTTTTHTDPNVPSAASQQNNPHLPLRLTQDLAVRNSRSIQLKRTASHWKLMRAQARVDIADIKGRWYEASILLPVLQPDTYAEAFRTGDVLEASLWMNARGDCTRGTSVSDTMGQQRPQQDGMRESRLAAFGAAVPPGTMIYDGDQPPPLPQSQQHQHQQRQQNASSGDNVAMDLDPRFEAAGMASSNDENITATASAGPHSQAHDSGTMDAFVDLDGGMGEGGFGHSGQQHHSGFY